MTVGAIESLAAPLSGVAPTSTTTGNGLGVSTTSKSNDKDMFLQLLVAQMKYQDPMNPTDSSQFLSQSAQFTALEKMQVVADQTGMLLGACLLYTSPSPRDS